MVSDAELDRFVFERFGNRRWSRSLNAPHRSDFSVPRYFLAGTFAPLLRASDKPIAMACFLLLTRPPFPPFPERSVPCFFRRIALFTLFPAALPYLAIASSSKN
jgi:hypothetical protein